MSALSFWKLAQLVLIGLQPMAGQDTLRLDLRIPGLGTEREERRRRCTRRGEYEGEERPCLRRAEDREA